MSVECILVHYILTEFVILFPLISQPNTLLDMYRLYTYVHSVNKLYYTYVHIIRMCVCGVDLFHCL